MKKLTAGIFATLLAVVSADGAYAAIASSGYVDDKVGEVSQTVTTLSGTVSGHTTQIGTINTNLEKKADKATTLSGYGITDAYTSAQGTALEGRVSAVEAPKATVATGQTGPVSGQTVYNAIQGVSGNVGTVTSDVEELKENMTQAQTDISGLKEASATHATKSELTSGLAGKQDKLSQTGSASQPVYVNAEGKVTAGNTIPTVTTSITTGQTGAAQAGAVATALAAKANSADLGALAKLNAVGSGQITDGAVATADIANKAVTEAKLSDTVNASLDKADSALQQGDLDDYVTETEANAAYAAKTLEGQVGVVSKENMGTTTATTVVAGVKEAIDAAKAADTKAVSAASAASAAQSAVDAVESTIGGYGDIVSHDASEFATTTALTSGLAGKLDKTGTAARATADASGNVITTTYATKEEIADLPTSANLELKQDKTDNSLATTNKTVVGAINEVRGTANTASSTATAAQSAAAAAQEDATKALADAATAQEAAEAAQTAANSKLPTATYNSQVGTVSATNMGTSASTVVAAIKEVAGEASTAQSAASAADSKAQAAQSAAEAADSKAQAAQTTANAAIPKPSGECANGTAKCVLTFNNSAYEWEVIARNGEGE